MSHGTRKYGIEYDVRTGKSYPYYDEELNYDGPDDNRQPETANPANADVTPVNKDEVKRRVYDTASYLTDQQNTTPRGYARKLSLGNILPPILNSLTVHFNKSSGTGAASHLATDMDVHIVIAGAVSLDPRSTAQASASITPAITWDIDTWHQDAEVNAIEYEFVDAPGKTVAELITRLNAQLGTSFLDLPVFKKKAVQFVLKGSQVSLQQTADTDVSISTNVEAGTGSSSKKKGSSNSVETGVNIRVEVTPYVLHGTLSLSTATDSQGVSVTVKANTPDIAETTITGVTNEPDPLTGTASASVTFADGSTSLGATTPAALDTTKSYVVAVRSEDDALGAVKYILTVVNFAQYGS